MSHLSTVQQTWALLDQFIHSKNDIVLDGESLSLAAVVAVSRWVQPIVHPMQIKLTLSRYSTKAVLPESPELAQRLQASVDALTAQLERGDQVYGTSRSQSRLFFGASGPSNVPRFKASIPAAEGMQTPGLGN